MGHNLGFSYLHVLILLTTSVAIAVSQPHRISVSINLPTTTTADSTSTTLWVDDGIYLAVSATPPDPLGIANVSGFYGPGAWPTWFLSVCGSWLHLSVD